MTISTAAMANKETDRGNGELRQRIQQFLSTRGICGMEGVHVDVDGGTVILRGRIASAHDRWLCVNCSSRVAGVLRVIDELEVEHLIAGPRRPK